MANHVAEVQKLTSVREWRHGQLKEPCRRGIKESVTSRICAKSYLVCGILVRHESEWPDHASKRNERLFMDNI